MRDLDLETLFGKSMFLVSSVLGWEIRVVRWIRMRKPVQKNVPFRNSEIGRSSSILVVASVCVPRQISGAVVSWWIQSGSSSMVQVSRCSSPLGPWFASQWVRDRIPPWNSFRGAIRFGGCLGMRAPKADGSGSVALHATPAREVK